MLFLYLLKPGSCFIFASNVTKASAAKNYLEQQGAARSSQKEPGAAQESPGESKSSLGEPRNKSGRGDSDLQVCTLVNLFGFIHNEQCRSAQMYRHA